METIVTRCDKPPVWLSPLFAFIAGIALSTGAFAPINLTPDYQRGHDAGYSAAWEDAHREVGADKIKTVIRAEVAAR